MKTNYFVTVYYTISTLRKLYSRDFFLMRYQMFHLNNERHAIAAFFAKKKNTENACICCSTQMSLIFST